MKLSIALFFFSTVLCSQNSIKKFPEDFLGTYVGKLLITNSTNTQEIDMQFHLLPTDTLTKFKYTLVYKSDKINQEKNYFLIEKDKSKGHYIIDENNGIILNATYANNALYTIFEVQGGLLITTKHFYENYMDFEIMYAQKNKADKSGNIPPDIPEVVSYPIQSVQKARLYKTK